MLYVFLKTPDGCRMFCGFDISLCEKGQTGDWFVFGSEGFGIIYCGLVVIFCHEGAKARRITKKGRATFCLWVYMALSFFATKAPRLEGSRRKVVQLSVFGSLWSCQHLSRRRYGTKDHKKNLVNLSVFGSLWYSYHLPRRR